MSLTVSSSLPSNIAVHEEETVQYCSFGFPFCCQPASYKKLPAYFQFDDGEEKTAFWLNNKGGTSFPQDSEDLHVFETDSFQTALLKVARVVSASMEHIRGYFEDVQGFYLKDSAASLVFRTAGKTPLKGEPLFTVADKTIGTWEGKVSKMTDENLSFAKEVYGDLMAINTVAMYSLYQLKGEIESLNKEETAEAFSKVARSILYRDWGVVKKECKENVTSVKEAAHSIFYRNWSSLKKECDENFTSVREAAYYTMTVIDSFSERALKSPFTKEGQKLVERALDQKEKMPEIESTARKVIYYLLKAGHALNDVADLYDTYNDLTGAKEDSGKK